MLSVSPTLDDKGTRGMVAFGGVFLGIASIITHFMGISSEYNAGLQLNKERNNGNQAYIQPAKEGIGLTHIAAKKAEIIAIQQFTTLGIPI